MASFYARSGRYYLDVYGFGRVSLGTNQSHAATIARHVDRIWRTKKLGLPLDPESLRFVEDTSERIRKRLRTIGLIEQDIAPTIAELVKMYERTLDVKASTSTTYTQATRVLYDFFGKDAAVRDVKKQDALEFRAWLQREGSIRVDEDGKRIGHGADVALKSYLMQTDDVWMRATGNQSATVPKQEKSNCKSS